MALKTILIPETPRQGATWFAAMIGTWLAVAFLAASVWIAISNLREVRKNVAFDDQVRQTELADMTVLSVLEGAETGQRGYLLTGDPAYLVPYDTAQRRLAERLVWLKQVSLLEPDQARRVTELQRLVQAKMVELSRTIQLQDAGHRQAALDLVKTNQGKRLMDAIRAQIHAIKLDAGKQLLAQRWHNHVRTRWGTAFGLSIFACLLIGGAALADRLARRTAAASQAALKTFTSAFDLAQGMLRDPEGKITFWSKGAERLYGFSPKEAVGQISHDLLRTEFPYPCPEIEAKLRDQGNWQGELVHYHRDGTPITVVSHWALHRRTYGKADAIIEVCNDITERKRDETRLRLLVHELNHRVKNTLATVQAIAARSLRKADLEQRKTLDARLLALASVHDVLTEAHWEGAELDEVVARVLAPHGGRDSVRFDVSGPPMKLRPRVALAFAMALHELATNALKYGALSGDTLSGAAGCVTVNWKIEAKDFHMVWSEHGGPKVVPPAQPGLGTILIERVLAQDLGGRVTLEFAADGVVCTIDSALVDIAPEMTDLPVVGIGKRK